MSMLLEGTYELSAAEGRVSGDKTVIFVKLTDSALKSVQECVPKKHQAILKPAVQFYSGNGVLKLPNRENCCKSYGFTLSSVEAEGSQGSFECLHLRETESLESLGCMLLKMQINAKEDVYEKTRVKMAAVEKENKKFCTKEIDPSGPYVGKKVKIKRPIATMLPKSGCHPSKYDKVTLKAGPSLPSGLRSQESSPVDEALKDVIDHSLEDGYSENKSSSKKGDLEDGNSTHSISFETDTASAEKRNPAYWELSIQKPHTKKKRISEIPELTVEANDDVESNIKKYNNDHEDFEMLPLKSVMLQENLQNFTKNMEDNYKRVFRGNSSELDVSLSCDDDVPEDDSESNHKINVLKSDHCEVSSNLDDITHFAPFEHFTEGVKDDMNVSSVTKACYDVEATCTGLETCHNINLEKERCVLSLSDESNQSFPSLNCLQGLESTTVKSNGEASEDSLSPSKYINLYSVITSQHQRQQYKADFDAEYEHYKVLHNHVKQAAMKFAAFENELKRHKPGSEEHVKIKERIYQEYFLNASDQAYQRAKNRLHFLHEKLSHIKRLVIEYDQTHAMEL